MKLLVIAAMLVGATAMAEVKFGANIATSMKNDSELQTVGTDKRDGQFNFDQGRFTITGGTDTLSFYARMDYQPVKAAAYNKDTLNINMANMTYKNSLGNWTFGRMGASNTGMESSTTGNNATWTSTMAAAVLNAAGYTDGVAYGRDLGFGNLTVLLGNGPGITNSSLVDDNKRYTTEFNLAGKAMSDKMEWFLGYHMGDEQEYAALDKYTLTNLWLNYMMNDTMSFAFEYFASSATLNDGDAVNANSMAFWGTYKMDIHAFTLRYEMLTEADNSNLYDGSKAAEKYTAITLADKIKLEDNLSFFAEYRMETADEDVFTDEDNEAKGSKSIMTVGLAAKF